jgi:hypothetical protein
LGRGEIVAETTTRLSRRACLGVIASWSMLSLARTASAEVSFLPTFPVLEVSAVPFLDAGGRALYERFLVANLPRAFAIASSGAVGWVGAAASIEEARAVALRDCAAAGGRDGALYAEDLAVVWQGRRWAAPPVPPPLFSTWNSAFVPDARYLWQGPARSPGVYVWGHGVGGGDNRGLQPQAHVRLFNNIGFDIVRFDRCPSADETERAAGWLRDGLARLRAMGWRRVIVGGQSRGAWNALQTLDMPGLADVVVAISPAAQGECGSPFMSSQTDELRRIVDDVAPLTKSALAFVQFAGDPYIGDAGRRRDLVERLRPRLSGLLTIDRPVGFRGHGAGADPRFAELYGPALLGVAERTGSFRISDRFTAQQ